MISQQVLKVVGVSILLTTSIGCQKQGDSDNPSSTTSAQQVSAEGQSAVYTGGAYAKETRYGYDYGQFDAEITLSNAAQALASGFSGSEEHLPSPDPGDDECQYVLKSNSQATMGVKIFRKMPGSDAKVNIFNRTYAVVFTASQSGLAPCNPFETQDFTASIVNVISQNDQSGQEEYLPTAKILDQGPGRESFPVMALAPTVNVKFDKSASQMGRPEVSLDLRISEYGKRDGKASMAESGSYYHGFATQILLK